MNNDTQDKSPLIKNLLTKGHSLNELGKYDEALVVLSEVLRMNPKNVSAWNSAGYALHKLKKYQGALNAFDEALKIDPNDDLTSRNQEIAEWDNARHLAITLNPYLNKLATLKERQEQVDDKPNNKGFIPLMTVILIGIVAIAGGTVATISMRHNNSIMTASVAESSSTATSSVDSEPLAPITLPQATTTSIIEQKPSVLVKQPSAIPSIEQPTSPTPHVVSAPAPSVQTPAPVNPYKDSLAAIDAFLANPTVSSLKDFCTKAKQLPGRGTQVGLDSSRTSMIESINTLYVDVTWCYLALNEDPTDHYTWMNYDPSLLISLSDPNDSDAIRTYKIKLNATMQSLGQSGIIGYDGSIAGGTDAHQDKRPQDVVDAITSNRFSSDQDQVGLMFLNLFKVSFIAPVEELTNRRQNYLPN